MHLRRARKLSEEEAEGEHDAAPTIHFHDVLMDAPVPHNNTRVDHLVMLYPVFPACLRPKLETLDQPEQAEGDVMLTAFDCESTVDRQLSVRTCPCPWDEYPQ